MERNAQSLERLAGYDLSNYKPTVVASSATTTKWNYDQLVNRPDRNAVSKAVVNLGKLLFKQP